MLTRLMYFLYEIIVPRDEEYADIIPRECHRLSPKIVHLGISHDPV